MDAAYARYTDIWRNTRLHLLAAAAVPAPDQLQVAAQLIALGCPVEAGNRNGHSARAIAALTRNVELLIFLNDQMALPWFYRELCGAHWMVLGFRKDPASTLDVCVRCTCSWLSRGETWDLGQPETPEEEKRIAPEIMAMRRVVRATRDTILARKRTICTFLGLQRRGVMRTWLDRGLEPKVLAYLQWFCFTPPSLCDGVRPDKRLKGETHL